MFTSRKLIVYVVLALVLFVGVSSVAAASTNSHQVVKNYPVSFTIPAGQCASLPAGVAVTGTGEGQAVINTGTLPNGNGEYFQSTLEKGTATDSNGGAHTFTYQNNTTVIALPSGQNQVSMTDTFVLSGPGPNYTVGFNWRWTYFPATEAIFPPAHDWVQVSTRGDPFTCDPL